MNDAWKNGMDLFNAGRFFDAHEALEDVWRDAPHHGCLRRHLQGLVQLAVAFHHQSTGNLIGARSVMERGLANLDGAQESFPELDLEPLRSNVNSWLAYLTTDLRDRDETSPQLPRLRFRNQPN